MPFVPKSDGRGYSIFPASSDPKPLALNGKLYAKLDGGVTQLFFQADNGVIYQITPGGAAVYPLQLPETTTPAPLANTGKLYAKDVAGVSQLFFLADDGTETQLTPAAGGSGQIADFVYDTGGVQAGNVYTTFAAVVAAANALGCNCRVRIAQFASPFVDASLLAGSYDVSRIQFWADDGASVPMLWFKGADLKGSSNLMFHNIIIQHESAGELVNSSTKRVDCVFSGRGGLKPTIGGPVFLGNGFPINVDFREQSQMQRRTFPVQKYFDCNGATIISVRAALPLDDNIRTPLPWRLSDFCTATANVVFYDNSNTPIASTIADYMGANNGAYNLGRRSNGGLNQLDLAPVAGTLNDYDPSFNFTADVFRFTLAGNTDLTGFASSPYNVVFANQGYAREVKFINAGGGNLTLKNNDAGSNAQNRFLTSTGADIVIPANGGGRLIFDVTSQKWWVWLL